MLENGLPTRDANMNLLKDLLGVPVVVKPAAAPLKEFFLLAPFITDSQDLAVVCGVDLPFAAYSTAALSQIPKAVAEEFIRAKQLEPNHLDNVREVINIVSSLFNVEGMPHVRLGQMASSKQPAFAALQRNLNAFKARTDHHITIERYGAGVMTFATRPPVPAKP